MLDAAGALRRRDGTVDSDRAVRAPTLPVTIIQHLRAPAPPTVELLSLASVLGASFTERVVADPAVAEAPAAAS